MGCVAGKFIVSNSIKGQGSNVLEIAKILKLSNIHIDGFYNHFKNLDLDNDNKVGIEEFMIVNDIQSKYFGELVFRVFDSDHSGSIDFEEYLVAMWNFCSLDKHSLITFTFNLFDVDNSGKLNKMEIQNIIDIIHGYKLTDRLNIAMKKLQGLVDGLTLKEFIIFSREFPIVIYPIFETQEKLQRCLFGQTRWHRLAVDRKLNFKDKTIFEILNCQPKFAHDALDSLIR